MTTHLIFDVDGTIIDTETVILKSLQQTLQEEGKDYSLDDLTFAFGIPGKTTLERLNVSETDRVLRNWVNNGFKFSDEVHIFEGIESTLHTLSERGVRMSVVTSKDRQGVKDEFAPFHLTSYFEHIVSADDTTHHKPQPDPLLLCLDKMAVDPKDVVYIGDATYDLQAAKEAGVDFALALWGSKTTEQFEEAEHILKEPGDILDLID